MGFFNQDNRINNQQNQIYTKTNLNKQQVNVLNRSLLIAGLGFLLIAILSFGLYHLELIAFEKHQNWFSSDGFTIAICISFFLSFIASVAWGFTDPMRGTFVVSGIVAWISFIFCQSFGFSLVYFLIKTEYLFCIFLVTAAIFGLLGFVGIVMKDKTARIMSIISTVAWIMLGILILTSIIISVVVAVHGGINQNFALIFSFAFSAVFLIALGTSIMFTFRQIARFQYFNTMNDETQNNYLRRITWLIGFNLLVQFIALLWRVIYFFLIIFGKK